MLLLNEEKLLDATVDIGSRIIPGVAGIVLRQVLILQMRRAVETHFVCIRPCICEVASLPQVRFYS